MDMESLLQEIVAEVNQVFGGQKAVPEALMDSIGLLQELSADINALVTSSIG